jgi:hypothetical protein
MERKQMAVSLTYLPQKLADILNYASQVHDLISAEGFTPSTVGLEAGDVTGLGTKLTAAQTAFDAVNAAKANAASKTEALTGPGAAMEQLLQELRNLANKAKASAATDDALAGIGVSRRNPTQTPTATPTEAPEFTLESVKPGIVNVRFREAGSASPRARLASAIGVQVSVVNGVAAPVDGEADNAPNVFASRNPAALNSSGWPASVRLYARWITQRGQTGPWSLPLSIAVV